MSGIRRGGNPRIVMFQLPIDCHASSSDRDDLELMVDVFRVVLSTSLSTARKLLRTLNENSSHSSSYYIDLNPSRLRTTSAV